MPFGIPNLADAAFAPQSGLDSRDVDALVAGFAQTGVVSGCAVTFVSGMQVTVVAGSVKINNATVAVTTGNLTAINDATNPRFALITVNTSGTRAITHGTAAAEPAFPTIPADSVLLAAVYIPAGATTLEANRITDKRVMLVGTTTAAAVAGAIDLGAAPYNIKFDGTAAATNTTALQAAIDDAEALLIAAAAGEGWAGAPKLVLRPGIMALSAPITLKTAPLVGHGPWFGSRIVWNGAAGATVFTKDPSRAGSYSYYQLYGFSLHSGSAIPGTWLDVSTGTELLDKFFRLYDVHFLQCSGDAIKFRGWINIHLEHLRWDGCGGYGMRLIAGATQNLSSFKLSDFTYDHQVSGGEGFIYIDNAANAANIGTVTLDHGRIEVNIAWNSPAAIVHLKLPTVGANPHTVAVNLDHVTYHDTSGMASDVILYQECPSSAYASPSLTLRDWQSEGLSALWGGNLPTQTPTMTMDSPYTRIDYFSTNSAQRFVVGTLELNTYNWGAGQMALLQRVKGDTTDRFGISATGTLEFGPGNAARDTNLYRSEANTLMTDDVLQAGSGAWNAGHLRLGAYRLWIDATGALRIKSGAAASDLDGVVVGTQT